MAVLSERGMADMVKDAMQACTNRADELANN
jgi:pyrroline-5-carboxylate reductase